MENGSRLLRDGGGFAPSVVRRSDTDEHAEERSQAEKVRTHARGGGFTFASTVNLVRAPILCLHAPHSLSLSLFLSLSLSLSLWLTDLASSEYRPKFPT